MPGAVSPRSFRWIHTPLLPQRPCLFRRHSLQRRLVGAQDLQREKTRGVRYLNGIAHTDFRRRLALSSVDSNRPDFDHLLSDCSPFDEPCKLQKFIQSHRFVPPDTRPQGSISKKPPEFQFFHKVPFPFPLFKIMASFWKRINSSFAAVPLESFVLSRSYSRLCFRTERMSTRIV